MNWQKDAPIPSMTDSPTVPQIPSITERIALTQVAPLRFRGGIHPGPSTRTFGGEVAGQAVLAAHHTVAIDRQIHSASMHFLLPGDTTAPVEFTVEPTRDGGSFSTRHVHAIQNHRVIFTMTASFQRDDTGLTHQIPTLDAPAPTSLPPVVDLLTDDVDSTRWAQWLFGSLDVEARFPELPLRAALARGQDTAPTQSVWLRARRAISESAADRAGALTYLSDVLLIATALGSHATEIDLNTVRMSTLSHRIWFHAQLSVDDWFLYDQSSRWAGNGRALCRGEIFDTQGRLCATTVQEGLIRPAR
ncbi:acyl-CoA thioesterase [Gordonia liuliyuniae]|uniref:Thioesterase family protein n=1 Tax=Gordonia liuliyuniae TaxID=2911517 RepID=A0ABS9IP20_9ACTN|nr:acyl-CoA thioesterase domain-containing protein [Gordonia liuliyuniae]MCF8587297.1 thioesterase family protein [Gordonia liuliyuniae]